MLERERMIQAYGYLYDIETSLKKLLQQRIARQPQPTSYWDVVNLVEQYQLLHMSPAEYKLLRKTVTIRNQICHMKEINSRDFYLLKKMNGMILKTSACWNIMLE